MRLSLPALLILARLGTAQVALLRIQVLEGEGAVWAPGARVSRPLVVTVSDETGKPVEGASVSFHLPEDGPGGAFGNGLRTDVAITDSSGHASLHAMQVNRTAGRFQIRVGGVQGASPRRRHRVPVRGRPQDCWRAGIPIAAHGGRLPRNAEVGGGGRAGWRRRGGRSPADRPWRFANAIHQPRDRPGIDWHPHDHGGQAMKWALWLLVALTPAWGQFQILSLNGSLEQPVGRTFDVGSVEPGATVVLPFRIRNYFPVAGSLQFLSVNGAGFSLSSSGLPRFPLTLAPSESLDFTVTFAPSGQGSYSASLDSVGIAVLFSANVPVELTRQLATSSGVRPLSAGPVDFGSVERGSSATRRVLLVNETSTTLPFPAVQISGAGFALPANLPVGSLTPDGECRLRRAVQPCGGWRRYRRTEHRRAQLHVDGGRGRAAAAACADFGVAAPAGECATGDVDDHVGLGVARQRVGYGDAEFCARGRSAGIVERRRDRVRHRRADSGVQRFARGHARTIRHVAERDVSDGDHGGNADRRRAVGRIHRSADHRDCAGGRGTDGGTGVTPSRADRDRPDGLRQHAVGGARSRLRSSMRRGTRWEPPIQADGAGAFGTYFKNATSGAFALRAVFPVAGDSSQIKSFQAAIANSVGQAGTGRTNF